MAWSRGMTWENYFETPREFKDLYLKKLGIEQRTPSQQYLDELVRKHQLVFPVENLDITDFHLPVHIDPQSLMKKILLKARGGFCFELNGAFSLLLKALGFDAWLCPCRPLQHAEPCPVPATHCAILIYLNGRARFADVGYGGPVPSGSIEFKENELQTVKKETFYFRKSGISPDDNTSNPEHSGWYTLIRRSQNTGQDMSLMQMTPIQQYLCDFYGQSLLRSSGDSAYEERQVSVRYTDGFANLQGKTLTVLKSGQRQVSEIDDSDLSLVLKKYFGIIV
ncbi:arylamine N-acetyltransferase [Secundilactobacillus pentosiphilus]|uniref:Arylamine N-acetyltransferase n=1 Tax=Secundilactobacillus pentosiphilus TaxID=1714682 RepID=A0A1Z5IMA0_9LACO|nr:arylamine N-acetyltransferase [Secundilactobacillus pentosiphilus]GAX02826.1 arylamine N-acetyltransferase [Secundilactobacillus pentosiphilus]